MESIEFIEFQKKRDFSLKLNVTFEFARQNFKGLGRGLLFIAGPPVLVVSLLMSSFFSDMFEMMGGIAQNPEVFNSYFLNASFALKIGMMFIFLMVSYVTVISTSYNYMIYYQENNGATPEVGEIWSRVRRTLGMYTGTTLLFVVTTILLYVIATLPIVLLRFVGPAFSVLGFIAVFLAVIYLMVAMSFLFCIRAFEGKGFFDATLRSLYLIRGKWWSTFGLVVLLTLVVMVITYLFTLPAGIIAAVAAAHRLEDKTTDQGILPTISYVLYALGYIMQMFLYVLPNLGLAFQYFNLVEMKEARGLMSKIDSIGEVHGPSKSEEHY